MQLYLFYNPTPQTKKGTLIILDSKLFFKKSLKYKINVAFIDIKPQPSYDYCRNGSKYSKKSQTHSQ